MKCISVKEFDLLNEKELKTKMGTDYKDSFRKLISFIEEFAASPENEDAYQFMSIKKNREYGEYVTFKNYVGLIELDGGLQIEILPKIETSDEDIKTIFLNMLKSMKDFEGRTFNLSSLKADKMNLYEIFITLYLQEVYRIVKKGLKSSYNTIEENLNVLKGRLNIKEQITTNLTHKDKFYVSHDEYTLNRPENRLIKTTLLFLIKETKNNNNKKLCKQLLTYFETVDVSYNIDADFSIFSFDRTNRDYETLLQWSKVYLKHKSFTTFSGQSKSKALLFQMDKLFESYVAKLMKEEMADTDYEVSTQDRGYYLFDTPEKFKLRPDIVVSKDESNIILDTKWKNLCNREKDNYGISQADMYQMYAYSKKYKNAPEIWLIYPLNKEMKSLKENLSFSSNDNVKVNVFFIDLVSPKDSIEELVNKMLEGR